MVTRPETRTTAFCMGGWLCDNHRLQGRAEAALHALARERAGEVG